VKDEKDPPDIDADHKLDLQLRESPEISYIWALNGSVNRSIGAQIQHRLKGLPEGTPINRVYIKER